MSVSGLRETQTEVFEKSFRQLVAQEPTAKIQVAETTKAGHFRVARGEGV